MLRIGYNSHMNLPVEQQSILVFCFIYSLISFYEGYINCKHKKGAFLLTPQYYVLGAFVWGDALVFGIFWMVVDAVVFFLNDWLLFLLVISIFWSVRGIGESIYWFNQQFSTVKRNPPEKLPFYHLFGSDAIWFVYQIVAQCVSVVAIIFSIYFAYVWLQTL